MLSGEETWNREGGRGVWTLLDGPGGCRPYWRDLRKEERVLCMCNFCGESLMVWTPFPGHRPIALEFVSCTVSSDDYQRLLKDYLLPYLRRPRGYYLVLPQINASILVSQSIKDSVSLMVEKSNDSSGPVVLKILTFVGGLLYPRSLKMEPIIPHFLVWWTSYMRHGLM